MSHYKTLVAMQITTESPLINNEHNVKTIARSVLSANRDYLQDMGFNHEPEVFALPVDSLAELLPVVIVVTHPENSDPEVYKLSLQEYKERIALLESHDCEHTFHVNHDHNGLMIELSYDKDELAELIAEYESGNS